MGTRIDFTASTSATLTFPATQPGTAVLPTADSNNTDLIVTNIGAGPVRFRFGNTAATIAGLTNVPIAPGATWLLTSPTTATKAADPRFVLPHAGAGSQSATGTVATGQGLTGTGTLVVSRGTASVKLHF